MSKRGFERRVYDKAERNLALCAVWCVGLKSGVHYHGNNAPTYPVIFGVSRDPDDVLRRAREWNWEQIDLIAVAWFASESDARAVRDEISEIVDDYINPIRGRWFDMTEDVANEAIQIAAEAVGVTILSEATRTERLRQEVRRQIEKMNRR